MASSSSKFQFILPLLCVFALSIIGASLAAEIAPIPSFSASLETNTCAVPQDKCASECNRRCSNTSHVNNCLLFCNKCCNKCLCVPPGTYGNKECCSCYNDWKTQQGGPKCP